MFVRGYVLRLLVGLAVLGLLGGCASSATSMPSQTPTATAETVTSPAAATTPSASASPASLTPAASATPVPMLAAVALPSPMPVRVTHVPFTPSVPCSASTAPTPVMCRLDLIIYAPTSGGPWPLVVFVPGASGTEKYDPTLTPDERAAANDWPEIGRPLAGQGAVVMVASYREEMSTGGGYPVTFEDIACAVGVARNIGATYGADPTRVTLVGHSDGGWPASVVALTPTPFTPPTGSCNATSGSLHPDAFVGMDGAYIMVSLSATAPQELLTPTVYADEVSRAAALAAEDPYALAKRYPAGPGSTSIHLLYGALDQTADVAWSQSLDDALAAAGYGSTLRLVPSADHMGVVSAPETMAFILALAKGN